MTGHLKLRFEVLAECEAPKEAPAMLNLLGRAIGI